MGDLYSSIGCTLVEVFPKRQRFGKTFAKNICDGIMNKDMNKWIE